MSHSPDSRVFARHSVCLRVWLRTGPRWQEMSTADVSRQGLFVCTQWTVRVDHLVPVRIELPHETTIEVLGRVCQVAANAEEHPSGPGLGLEFFALSPQIKEQWDDFIRALRREHPSGENYTEDVQVLQYNAEARAAREMLQQARASGAYRAPTRALRQTVPDAGAVAVWAARSTGAVLPPVRFAAAVAAPAAADADQPHTAPAGPAVQGRGADTAQSDAWTPHTEPAVAPVKVVSVHPSSTARLSQLAARCAAGGYLFLRPSCPVLVGERLRVAVVHPDTDAEFGLLATVQLLVTDEDGIDVGVQAQFEPPQGVAAARLAAFVATGAPAASVVRPGA